MDGWPVDVPRKVGFQITLLTTNLDVCLSGRFVTVLPDIAAHPHLEEQRLHRIGVDLIDGVDLYAARRSEEGEAAIRVIQAVKQRVAAVDEMLVEQL